MNQEEGFEAMTKTNYQEVMKEVLPQYEPRLESSEDLLRRRKLIEGFLNRHLKTNPLRRTQRHAVITHSMLMAGMTAEGADDTDKRGFRNYTWAENC